MRSTAVIGLLLVLAMDLCAQVEAGFAARVAILGDRVEYRIAVERSGEGAEEAPAPPVPPVSPDFEIRYIDARDARHSEAYISGGRVFRKSTVRTTYVYEVVPKAAGTLTIPAFPWTLGDKTVRVPEATLRVEAEAPGNRFVEVELTATPESAWVGQPVTVRIALTFEREFYEGGSRRLALTAPWFASAAGFVADPPDRATERVRGFVPMVIDEAFYNFRLERAARGERTSLRLVYDRELIPVRAGRLYLDAVTFQGDIVDEYGVNIFGEREPRTVIRAVRTSRPLEIHVRDVPEEGRPSSFTNAVGTFTVTLRAGPAEIRAGDPVTITLTVSGRGNVEGITLPPLSGFQDFTCYEPESKVAPIEGGGPGAKKLEVAWLVIPKSPAVRELPAVDFSWFDPSEGRFRTESTGRLPLTITGETAEAPLVAAPAADRAKREIEARRVVLAAKIDPGTLRPRRDALFGTDFFLMAGLPLVSLVSIAVVRRRRDRLHRDAGAMRRAGALAAARRRLAEASGAPPASAIDAAARALEGFVADRLGLPPAGVPAPIARDRLMAAGVGRDLADEVVVLLGALEAARFAAGTAGPPERTLGVVGDLIARLDRRLPR